MVLLKMKIFYILAAVIVGSFSTKKQFACEELSLYQQNKCRLCFGCAMTNDSTPTFPCMQLQECSYPLQNLLNKCKPGTDFRLDGYPCRCVESYGTMCKFF